jgi:hypothetical protein
MLFDIKNYNHGHVIIIILHFEKVNCFASIEFCDVTFTRFWTLTDKHMSKKIAITYMYLVIGIFML